ncbi:hypothetical protein COCVIDRAFT_86417, partial [Bipolaris victoriae FI3]
WGHTFFLGSRLVLIYLSALETLSLSSFIIPRPSVSLSFFPSWVVGWIFLFVF